jgi:hypothetical protein
LEDYSKVAQPVLPTPAPAPAWLRFIQPAAIVALIGALIYVKTSQPPPQATAPAPTIIERVVQKATGALTRPDALALLQQHAAEMATEQTNGLFLSGANYEGDTVSAFLRAQNYIACSIVHTYNYARTTCTLTAKGRAQHWQTQPIQQYTRVTIPLANVHFTRVTGILSNPIGFATGTQTADVDFTEAPNELGTSMLAWAGSRKFCGTDYRKLWNTPHTGQAVFARYDDGYRIGGFNVAGEALFDTSSCLFSSL